MFSFRYLPAALAASVLLMGMPSAHAATGKQLFQSRCAACHRNDGSGGMKFGNAVSADLRSPALEDTYHHDDRLILRAILQGRDEDGKPLDAPMPHWQGKISKREAEKIITYLRTLCCNKGKEPHEATEKSEK